MTDAAPIDPLTPPPTACHVVAEGGEVFNWQPRADVGVHRLSGAVSLPIIASLGEFYGDSLHAGAKLRLFLDIEAGTTYTREAREWMTAFTRQHALCIEVIHILVSSKIMALGVSVYRQAIGDERICTYSDRASFLRAYEEALGRSRYIL